MKRTLLPRLLLVLLRVSGAQSRTVPVTPAEPTPHYTAAAARASITETLEIWTDRSRGRDVPVRIYAPVGDGPFPLIVFSHGLGSSRNGYVFLGRAWAERGYVVIHVQHRGSDSEVLRTRGYRAIYHAAYDADEYVQRPADVHFVLDEVERRAATRDSLWSKIDLHHIGAAGHSYGAHTVLTVAGMLVNFPGQPGRSFKDPRVRAVLVLSAPAMTWSPTRKEFAPIDIPSMTMSGTKDRSIIWRTWLHHRRRPFDSITATPRWFLDIAGARHQSFADFESIAAAKENGRLDRVEPPIMTPRNAAREGEVALIIDYSLAFWDATLRDDADASRWLQRMPPAGARLERRAK